MNPPPQCIAIVGGSGSGKTWLASHLEQLLQPGAARISLDDFYRDRSHLPEHRRGRCNFDSPRAIDWFAIENVLQTFRNGQPIAIPRYNFLTHTRQAALEILEPRRYLIVEGLWLLHRPALRRIFDFKIFLDCPTKIRFQRRLERDQLERGRSVESIRQQFEEQVLPMHKKYVDPQRRWADWICPPQLSLQEVHVIAGLIQKTIAEPPRFLDAQPRDARCLHLLTQPSL